jgi:hypothetical protein
MAIIPKRRFTGRVTDNQGNPLQNVRVCWSNRSGDCQVVNNSQIQVLTDVGGKFAIQIPYTQVNCITTPCPSPMILPPYLHFKHVTEDPQIVKIDYDLTDLGDVILGGGTQDVSTQDEIVVIGTRPDPKKQWYKKWWPWVILAILTAVVVTLIVKKSK